LTATTWDLFVGLCGVNGLTASVRPRFWISEMVPIQLGIDTPHAVPIAQVAGVGFHDLAVDLDMRAGFIN
jgi:hypothetical protein